jgi:predicted O-linked N-acetylglucosamine transferase (SPINDLY family)
VPITRNLRVSGDGHALLCPSYAGLIFNHALLLTSIRLKIQKDPKLFNMQTSSPLELASWQQQAEQLYQLGEYGAAIPLYEQGLETDPEVKAYYWQLGLLYLLEGQEEEAQTAWMFGMGDGSEAEVAQWTQDLVEILDAAAQQQAATSPSSAWLIRQHLHTLAPDHIPNLLQITALALYLERWSETDLEELGLVEYLKQAPPHTVDQDDLIQVLEHAFAASPVLTPTLNAWVEACLPQIQNLGQFMAVVIRTAIHYSYTVGQPSGAAVLVELYRRLDPDNSEILAHLAAFYQNARQYDQGIAIARRYCEVAKTLSEQIFANHTLMRGLLSAGGYWDPALEAYDRHQNLLSAIIAENPLDLNSVYVSRLFTSSFFLPYFQDNVAHHRPLQNQVMQLAERNLVQQEQARVDQYQAGHRARQSAPGAKLRIGYISHCLARHSVGWLARWLIQHHNRDQVELYGYFISPRPQDSLQDWYIHQFDQACRVGTDIPADYGSIADRIFADHIDILIDLDSITLDLTCQVMALKPAPVQVTWLGLDGSGLSAIDYFIADPYVLAEDAQTHYAEKIWRLPQTYLAVGGFEVGTPTLRRDDLGIPADAVTYLSAQRGYKRHRDTAKLQMQIIKQVPNSYFLIKGFADETSIQKFFRDLAAEIGVDADRLIFLPDAPCEEAHRANLKIADVVLDTFPYNGATTTLETLWMEIPLVTRVGQQFAARNSYTMLQNVGITEGIAWTDAEYVEWGVRLGLDADLRQQVAWKLRQSKQTAPLWNAKAFTRDMETAYAQMWQAYGGQNPAPAKAL